MQRDRRLFSTLFLSFAAPLLAQSMPAPAKACFDQAYKLMQKGHVAKAIAKYEEALALAPQARDLLVEYVVALRKGCRYQRSVKMGWRLLELDAASAPAWGNLGNTFLAAGEWDAAQFVYDKAAALAKDKAWGAQNLLNLGQRQCEAGDAQGALKVFAKAAKLDPKNGLALIDTAVAQWKLGNKEQALATARAAVAQLQKQNDQRSKALRSYAELTLKELEQDAPKFPDTRPAYSQSLPKQLCKQPEKGKAAALAIASEVEHVVRATGQRLCSLKAPEAWTLVVDEASGRDAGQPPLTLDFTAPGDGRFQLLLSVVGDAPPAERVKALVEKVGQGQLASAVEKSVDVQELTSATARGFYFSLQDKELAGQEPPEGQFPFVTQGMLLAGDLLFSFTLLTCDRDDKTMVPLFDVLKGVAVKPMGT